MKRGFYLKLAWSGIRKNRRLYTPYLLTCVGMVMMFYVVSFLSECPVLEEMRGGMTLQSMLSFGSWVIGAFALIFLFYTNSFLIRRRKKEFGLYNILGMGKGNLARILLWESLIVAGIALIAGLFFGILLSKLAELGMVNLVNGDITFSLSLGPDAILRTLLLFAVIFLLLLLNALRQIHLTNPIELIHSENAGERPPKANWFLALAGIVILGAAYFIAVTIEDPVEALVWFFAAVIMVIVSTYLIFVSGSVAICRVLQKNKKYYYKTNHFVSVSSMVYRMKRNGAGLASICILYTMVLVMLSTTVCLYLGTEDSLRTRYPRNFTVEALVSDLDTLRKSDKPEAIIKLSEQAVQDHHQGMKNVLNYRCASSVGYWEQDTLRIGEEEFYNSGNDVSEMWYLNVVPIEDYNRLTQSNEVLKPGEAIAYSTAQDFSRDTIMMENTGPVKIKKATTNFSDFNMSPGVTNPSLYLFVPDYEEYLTPLLQLTDSYGNSRFSLFWHYGFDMDCDDETQIMVDAEIQEKISELPPNDTESYFAIMTESIAANRTEFYINNGGLFFLGLLLGIVFLFAAVLIMYYKQISEGYEDQSRFGIMQKVGMTKKEIRKSINSQVLTVFFLPLIAAGLHLTFAFPMISKLLVLFGLTNTKLLILVTVLCYLVFALFYILVYRITSKAYYSIVSGAKEEN